ncbi:MAG TPA: pitrilysin family protein [Candidatus Nanoarchaeia archaeon]|nr:pitrilysin family protein [Candidatus Nanoarchaeia archaeon]
MQKVVLDNGLTLLFQEKKGNAVVVEVLVKVGSNQETDKEKGLSHFIEHMLFEGTKNYPTNWLLSNEIEKIGGEFNAYTTNERTCFYVKVLKKHYPKAVEILAEIIKNPLFKKEELEKEKNIVIKEIDLVNDEPRYYQWDLLLRTMYTHHPSKYPVYGKKEVIRNLTQEKVLNYFHRYYSPNNMIISVVGDLKDWKKEMLKHFLLNKNRLPSVKTIKEPNQTKNITKTEKKKILSTYTVLGFKTVPKDHPDSYVLDVINGVLGRGQSGRMFTEIRAKKGLAYDVGTQNLNDHTFGYFAVYATVDKKKLQIVKSTVLSELKKLRKLNPKDLQEAKDYIEGDYLLEVEDPQKVADQLVFWEQINHAQKMYEYVQQIKKVTLSDVKRVVDKYFKHYTWVIVEGK